MAPYQQCDDSVAVLEPEMIECYSFQRTGGRSARRLVFRYHSADQSSIADRAKRDHDRIQFRLAAFGVQTL